MLLCENGTVSSKGATFCLLDSAPDSANDFVRRPADVADLAEVYTNWTNLCEKSKVYC